MGREETELKNGFDSIGSETSEKRKKLNLDEFLFNYRWPIGVFLFGAILLGLGIFLTQNTLSPKSTKIEVLENTTEGKSADPDVVVEVSGAVEKPGVYRLSLSARVEDALIAAGGVSSVADRQWMERSLNRAGRISDGQKIYIPKEGENTSVTKGITTSTGGGGVVAKSNVNINTASQKELEELPGIGPVYAQNIIEYRPYSTVEELLSKGALKKNVYEKIKDKVTVY